MQRRRLLQLSLASAAALALAGGASALFQAGLAHGTLTSSGRSIFQTAAQAILDKTLPTAGPAGTAAMTGLLDRVDGLILALAEHAQAELSQLLSLLCSSPGRLLLTGNIQSWTGASLHELQQTLEAMRLSTLAIRQQAYAALHDITAGGYFSDASTCPVLGYPGPVAL